MKKIITPLLLILCGNAFSQNVGIGTTNPKARLHVADSAVLFTGSTYLSASPGPVPASGTGVRMMWYPAKAAFRAGQVFDNNWDKDSIGDFTFAAGYNPKALSSGSVAIGFDVAALGNSSTALGIRTVAGGNFSTALGNETKASGYQSTALGYKAEARGNTSFSIGYNTISKSPYSAVFGLYNDTLLTDRLFEIGNGNSLDRRNAVTVLFNGNVGIGTTLPAAKLHVDNSVVFTGAASLPASPANTPITGAGTRTMWYADKAAFRTGYVTANQWDKDNIGNYSFAAGRNSIASAPESVSLGGGNTAAGNNSFSAGNNSQAMGIADIAIGSYAIANGFIAYSLGYNTLSNGTMSYAFGQNTVASAWTSTSMGAFTKAKSNYSLVIGQFNDTTATNRLFEIGNGTTDNDRRNAFTVLNNGYVGIGHKAPTRPLSFPATLGEKILLYPGGNGEVGIGVYGNELRLHADNPGAKVSFGTQTNAGVFTEAGKFEISNGYALTVFGNIWANGITYNSDARFKKNIVPLKDPLKKLQQINGVQYQMMTDEFPEKNFIKGTQVGLLAQEVEAVMPEVVSTNADGYKSVDYAKLVPLLIESIKELKHQMGTMQDEINTLKNKQGTAAK